MVFKEALDKLNLSTIKISFIALVYEFHHHIYYPTPFQSIIYKIGSAKVFKINKLLNYSMH